MISLATSRVLARCNGFRVTAGDEVVGAVATPVFSGTQLLPDYLLVRVSDEIPGAYREVPSNLIASADANSQTVALELTVDELAALPEPRSAQGDDGETDPGGATGGHNEHVAE